MMRTRSFRPNRFHAVLLLAPLALPLACRPSETVRPPPAVVAPEQEPPTPPPLPPSPEREPGFEQDGPATPALPEGALTLVGVREDGFNSLSATLSFELLGAKFWDTPDAIALFINDVAVPADRLTLSENRIAAREVLSDGKNTIRLEAADADGYPLYFTRTVWAGASPVEVRLLGPDGSPFSAATEVLARLSDNPEITARTTSSEGLVRFENLPARTVIFEAVADGFTGQSGMLASEGRTEIPMFGFEPPSAVSNNDISAGTAGWNVRSEPVDIIPHEEQPGPAEESGAMPEDEVAPVVQPLAAQPDTLHALVNNDLVLATQGQGERRISRSFTTSPGTSAVRLRYRYITSEVPGGYFGSRFNDYFRVALRSRQAVKNIGEANSMNGLGLKAFNFQTGSTRWRDVILEVLPEGDVIQVDAAVANVGDADLDSFVVIDFIEEVKEQVRPALTWNSKAGGLNLSYRVDNGPLAMATTIRVHFATSSEYTSRAGLAVFTQVVPAGTGVGQYGPFHIEGDRLREDPMGTTHFIAGTSPTRYVALKDVWVRPGERAKMADVSAAMEDVLKDSLRFAGVAQAWITSTRRTSTDQARIMFQNLAGKGPSPNVDLNVAENLELYMDPGDAVIRVFVERSRGLTPQEIKNASQSIQTDMKAEIERQKCERVSRHCAEAAKRTVIDVGAAAISTGNVSLFLQEAGRRSKVLDERTPNGCYHLEVLPSGPNTKPPT